MHLLLSTIALRPYVFIFLASFLFIAIVNFGLRTTILFTLLTYAVSLACEWSSVHNGFPFGLYHYIVALLLSSPLYRRGADFRILDTWEIRRAPRVWLMAALFMVMVDMVVDPLSVLGDRWFLGRIFWYDPPGPHFGVPISNYLGWYFVAAITIAIFQWLDAAPNRGSAKPAGLRPALRSRALLGPALYAGIVLFGITMLFRINAPNIGWAAVFIYLPFSVLAIHILTRRESWGDAAAIERHLADFPYERDLPVWKPESARTHELRSATA